MQKNLSLTFVLVVTLLCATIASAQTAAAPAAADKAATAKIVQLLEGSGHGYTKAKDGVWVIKYEGKQLSEFAVVTLYAEGMVIFVATVAEKAEYKPAPELLQKLLHLNDNLDRVKVGIDDKDGEIFVRIDLTLRITDLEEFKANLEQISAAVDETYVVVKPFLLAPKKAAK
jgi:Putative bacterial sensory transduction regulator